MKPLDKQLTKLEQARMAFLAVTSRYSDEYYLALQKWEAAYKAVFTAGPTNKIPDPSVSSWGQGLIDAKGRQYSPIINGSPV